VLDALDGRHPALFLDYDGTLTPIVSRPELAVLDPAMRDVLRRLAARCPVAVVSGRDRPDVAALVGLDGIVYAGSHGFDISGPGGLALEHEGGHASLDELDAVERRLRRPVEAIPGALVERKLFAIAVHYRNVPDADVARVRAIVEGAAADCRRVRTTGGKKIFEVRPAIDWDKGRAVLWLLEALALDRPDVVPIYVGDDETDEDAFRAIAGRGIGIRVGGPSEPTAATERLDDVPAVRRFLEELADRLHGAATARRD
jgi:alpha,alpha-trehalase